MADNSGAAVNTRLPVHTPYDGSHPAFRIGLQPLELSEWIEVDDKLDFHLREKDRLARLYPGKTFMAEPGTGNAQREVLVLLCDCLPKRFPATYRRAGQVMHVNGRVVQLDDGRPELLVASRLVQEDLLVMRRGDNGWRLAAGALSFPSSWSLAEKFGRPMEEIHGPVPGFGKGTRNAAMINRIFDRLHADRPVWRMNWSLYDNDALFHDHRMSGEGRLAGSRTPPFLRVERQTLRKLPASGDILFTVRIHIDPFEVLERLSDRERVCEGLARSLEQLDPEQAVYKGLSDGRAALARHLRQIGGGG